MGEVPTQFSLSRSGKAAGELWAKSRTAGTSVANKLVEYVAIISAVSRAIYVHSFRPLLLFLLFAFLHIGLVFLSFYLLYLLVHGFSHVLTAQPTAPNLTTAYLLLVPLLLSLAAAAFSNYGAMRTVLVIAADVERASIRRVLQLYATLPRYGSLFANHFIGGKRVMRLLATDSRYCGIVARALLRTVPELVFVIGSLGIMLYFDFWLTLMLVGLSGILILMLYPAHLGVAGATRKLERTRPAQVRGMRTMIDAVDQMTTGSTAMKAELAKLDQAHAVAGAESFYQRLKYIEFGTLLARVSSAVVLCVALLALLHKGTTGTLNVAVLMVYLAAARQLLANVTALSRSLVTMSRFYPQLSRYFRFIWSATGQWPLLAPQVDVRNVSHKELRGQVGWSLNAEASPIKRGATYRVFTRTGWTRSSAAALIDIMDFPADDLQSHEPRIIFGSAAAEEEELPVDGTATGKLAKPDPSAGWDVLLLPADTDSGSPAASPRDLSASAETRLYFSNYRDKESGPMDADLFIVLDLDNQLAIQTPDRLEALKKIGDVVVRRTTADSTVGGDAGAVLDEDEEAEDML